MAKPSRYNHWTDEEIKSLDEIATCADMYLVARPILERIPAPVIQVCGPISTGGVGTIEGNLAAMAQAIQYLEERGNNVFNQLPFEVPMHKIVESYKKSGYAMPILEDFYLPIFESRLVSILHFLPDWQSSIGAKWEHEQAKRLGIDIKYFDHGWQAET